MRSGCHYNLVGNLTDWQTKSATDFASSYITALLSLCPSESLSMRWITSSQYPESKDVIDYATCHICVQVQPRDLEQLALHCSCLTHLRLDRLLALGPAQLAMFLNRCPYLEDLQVTAK